MFPDKLHKKLLNRIENRSLRGLATRDDLIDFSSNDYLGFAKSEAIFNKAHQYLLDSSLKVNGATGSRLLSGNYSLYNELEAKLSNYHNSESALLFNSGYNANLGLFSSVPQRGDIILYDEYAHASIRDGIKLSNAKAYKFQHNNLDDLSSQLERSREFFSENEIYVVTESVFSMDGDSPDLKAMLQITKKHKAHLIIDEAHALGVFDFGLIQQLRIEKDVFARIMTFGKALGCHGAAILASNQLKKYLINFSRPFIYTTAMTPHSLSLIKVAYNELNSAKGDQKLENIIQFFKSKIDELGVSKYFINSNSAIQSCIISGNKEVKDISNLLLQNSFDVKPILSPTVPEGEERLRFCLHIYNTKEEITNVLELLCNFVKTN
ncbi:aminotransferase class I/II-fold pyridoxal phosphate-dependent enzyme [Pseudofulvibacter geojedonensis]|uniref:Aminotransferase class I/II-fold pyridoxal phosphate-dependent enzyme n=1 Tax=Pseudofulvibacter geojedonensis TaxID=1123758 RepID=A0ABW3I4J9_9FLAO